MSNKKKTREAEERAKLADAEANKLREQAAANATQNVKLSPQAEMVLQGAGKDYEAARSGNVRNIGRVANYLAQEGESMKTASRISPTGSASLAADVANPTLIAMNRDKLNREGAQRTAQGVTALAADAEDDAISTIGGFSGMDLSARSALAGFMFQNAGMAANQSSQAWDRYKFEKQQKPFWQQMALAGIGAAGNVFTGAMGK